MTTHPLS